MNGWVELLGKRVGTVPTRGRSAGRHLGRVTARWRARTVAAVMLAGCAFAVLPSRALAQASREYDVKAALLFNFTRFVEWPADAFAQPDTPVVIGVLGNDPFGPVIDEIVRHETWAGRSITVERFRNVEAARNCQILFVGASEAANLPRILRVVRGRPILTVGDFEGFGLRGGMIRLMKDTAGKIQLRINLEELKTSGLIVSAKLLRVAEVVGVAGR